jgi:hypothetical protein
MPGDWNELTRFTDGEQMVVERVRLTGSSIAIEGSFELPPLARLSAEDQVFVMAFVRSHGSIKEMERIFGISYPTVKNRLNRISSRFDLLDMEPSPSQSEILAQLERGEISAEEAIERLSR